MNRNSIARGSVLCAPENSGSEILQRSSLAAGRSSSSRRAPGGSPPSTVFRPLLKRVGMFLAAAFCVAVLSAATQAQIATGSYTGDGMDGRAITGVGFQPDVVIIKGDATALGGVLRTSTMVGDLSKPTGTGTALTENLVQSLDADGFTIGNDDRVNLLTDPVTQFYWIAFKADSHLKVGTYTGTGTTAGTTQAITGVGFSPEYVIVASSGNNLVQQKASTFPADQTYDFSTGGGTGRILSLDSDGFTVGANATVNTTNTVYHYVAWNEISGRMKVGSYIGNGMDDRSITGAGFQPVYVIVKNQNTTARRSFQKPSSLPDPRSMPLTANATSTINIKALQADGFQVGTGVEANENGQTISYMAFGAVPTAVKLTSFNALSAGGRAVLKWETGYEVDNLGFNIYREIDGNREKITPSLIAGSALIAGRGTPLTAGNSYLWFDTFPAKGANVQYWLEDIDLDGTRTMHGPVIPVSSSDSRITGQERAALLRELNDRSQFDATLQNFERGFAANASNKAGGEADTTLALSSESIQAAGVDSEKQFEIAAKNAIKLAVNQTGWHRVTFGQLVAAGLSSATDPRRLQLFKDGVEIPILTSTANKSKFTQSDYIEFFGEGLDTLSTDARTYWLVTGAGAGKRISSSQASGRTNVAVPQSFLFTTELRERTLYFTNLRNGDVSNFFGQVVTTDPASHTLNVTGLHAGGGVSLEIALQGVTSLGHHVRVVVNGTEVGTIEYTGRVLETFNLNVPQALVVEGANTVTLNAQGEADVTIVDYIRLTYPRLYRAQNNALNFSVSNASAARVDGFTSSNIRLIDITDPDSPREIAVKSQQSNGGYSILFPVSGDREFLAFAGVPGASLAGIKANAPSQLNSFAGAELLIISHADFLESVAPLAALRQGQGLSTRVVDVEDVYDEFGFGAPSAGAIKSFLSHASESWEVKPRFVLIVGDTTYDARNFLGFGFSDFVSTKLIDTAFMETASDDWLVDFDDDGIADIAIGRLPATSRADADVMVGKIITFEAGLSGALSRGALIVADDRPDFDFEGASANVGTLLTPFTSVQSINRSDGSTSFVRSQLNAALNGGPAIVNFLGHGAIDRWASNALLTNADADALSNGDRLSVYIMMTCWTGYFHSAFRDTLSEVLLKREGGGAVAAWASSGLTVPFQQSSINMELYRLLLDGDGMTLGEAALRAKSVTSDEDVRRTWVLLGDPAMKVK